MKRSLIVFWVGFLFFGPVVEAYVASSTNYRLQSDSLNFGGTFSSTTNYAVEDTFGEIGSGDLTGTVYNLKSGYQAMLISSLSISVPADVSMTPDLNGVTGGTASGSTGWQVITDSPSGYTLAVKALTNPALASGSNYFSDYLPAGSVPDFTWTVPTTVNRFGFSPEGSDVASRYLDNGTICGTGALETSDRCWDGFSTSNATIASVANGNSPAGATTTIKFQATVGSETTQNQAAYTATIVATALAQ